MPFLRLEYSPCVFVLNCDPVFGSGTAGLPGRSHCRQTTLADISILLSVCILVPGAHTLAFCGSHGRVHWSLLDHQFDRSCRQVFYRLGIGEQYVSEEQFSNHFVFPWLWCARNYGPDYYHESGVELRNLLEIALVESGDGAKFQFCAGRDHAGFITRGDSLSHPAVEAAAGNGNCFWRVDFDSNVLLRTGGHGPFTYPLLASGDFAQLCCFVDRLDMGGLETPIGCPGS